MDVVIAVHTRTRPIGRAVASVVEGNPEAQVVVVCHDVPVVAIRAEVRSEHRDAVRFLEHRDGLRRPAGPFNAGLAAAAGAWVSIMGSDDTLEPGAVASWLRAADRHRAEVVITRLLRGGRTVPTPPVRPWGSGPLDPVRDRVNYRSAPLGLLSTATIRRLGLRLDETVTVGEDVGFATRLWSEARCVYDRSGPGYVIGEGAPDRLTMTGQPIAEELAFLGAIAGSDWFRGLPERQRTAAAIKYTRIHLFGAVFHRQDPQWWTAEERTALARVAEDLITAAPGLTRPLSVADSRLLAAIRRRAEPAQVLHLARRRRRHGTPGTVLTSDPTALFDIEGPLRLMGASALLRRWPNRGPYPEPARARRR